MLSFKAISQHKQICEYHDSDPTLCSAMTQDGLPCFALASPYRDINRMPTCRRHRMRDIKGSYCRALQRCGYPCHTMSEWKPLTEVNFCEKHRTDGPCYFLQQLPLELRFEIYSYIFPCRLIPAKGSSAETKYITQRSDPKAILQVNRQVYEEACLVLYQQTQFGIHITEDAVDILGISRARVQSPLLLSHELGSNCTAGFIEYLLRIRSRNPSSSPSTSFSKSLGQLWANFPVKEPLWRKMKSFHIDINIPGLSQQNHTATEISENMILGFDMVCRVAEYLEVIRPNIRNLDIVVRIFRIRAYPVAIISQFINAVFHSFSNLWSLKHLKIYLAFTSIQESLFDVLSGPLHKVEEAFRYDALILRDTVKELRIKITQHKSQTPLSSDRHPLAKPIERGNLYHLEAILQALYHPLMFSFIQQEANRLKEAHKSAVIAEYKRELDKFGDAYSQISHVLESYKCAQDRLARIISQRVQTNLRELNSTDDDPTKINLTQKKS
ncbi:hypothetical protein BDV19DRAFT_374857 [Aspergillus venezuelensis]